MIRGKGGMVALVGTADAREIEARIPAGDDAYIAALCEVYLFYPVSRYDIKGKELLKTGSKYYVADTGIRNFLQGYRDADQDRAFEHMVYLQLRYDGYDVAVGKLRGGEVDFAVTKARERRYIQVAEDMGDAETMRRELTPLRAIRDAYPKMVVGLGGAIPWPWTASPSDPAQISCCTGGSRCPARMVRSRAVRSFGARPRTRARGRRRFAQFERAGSVIRTLAL